MKPIKCLLLLCLLLGFIKGISPCSAQIIPEKLSLAKAVDTNAVYIAAFKTNTVELQVGPIYSANQQHFQNYHLDRGTIGMELGSVFWLGNYGLGQFNGITDLNNIGSAVFDYTLTTAELRVMFNRFYIAGESGGGMEFKGSGAFTEIGISAEYLWTKHLGQLVRVRDEFFIGPAGDRLTVATELTWQF